jgi:hypothetical protein
MPTKRAKTTQALRLSWPEVEIQDLLIYMDSNKQVVYGAGRYENDKFIISSRTGGKNQLNNSFMTVPKIYGRHLEQLVYNFRFYILAWNHLIENFFDRKKRRFPPKYETAITVFGRFGKYHGDALHDVVKEVKGLDAHIFLPSARIRTLDEWVIRQRYSLIYAETEELERARINGIFKKDIVHDADDLG